MKFSLALGLLMLALTNADLLEPKQIKADNFLRGSQHLSQSAELVSIKQNGQFYNMIYKDGPVNIKYDVRATDDKFKIVGIQQMISFSNTFSLIPQPSKESGRNVGVQKLLPLPLIMPHFSVANGNQLQMRNVFDVVDKEITQMQQKMEEDRKHFKEAMSKRCKQMQGRFNLNKEKQAPLLGGDHDYNQATNIQRDQPLIGAGDHDLIWNNIEIEPLIGGGQHDNWLDNKQTNEELHHPIIGGDDHDDWKKRHGRKDIKLDHKGKQKRHHKKQSWKNRQFSTEELSAILESKLPDMMEGGKVIAVGNKGFQKGKGFNLLIQFKNKQEDVFNLQASFKPRKQQLLINKIQKIKTKDSYLQTGKELIGKLMGDIKEDTLIPTFQLQKQVQVQAENHQTQDSVTTNVIAEPKKQSLPGGKSDQDNDPEMMKLVADSEQQQNNHIPFIKDNEQLHHVPLLGGQSDPDHPMGVPDKVEQLYMKNLARQTDAQSELNFQKIVNAIMDIGQKLKGKQQTSDIEEVQQVPQKQGEQKLKLFVK